MGACITTAESLCCPPETITILLISYTQNKKKLFFLSIILLFLILGRNILVYNPLIWCFLKIFVDILYQNEETPLKSTKSFYHE